MNEITLPDCDTNDPASLEAFYGNFGYADHWRKVALANCREIIRAKAALDGEKISEARIDDLARTHDIYLNFLTVHLKGREMREAMVKQYMGA